MLNNCIFRGTIALGEKDIEYKEGTVKSTGKDWTMCKFRVNVYCGKSQDGDNVYHTLFLNTFSDFVIKDIQAHAALHEDDEKPKADVNVVVRFKPYEKEVFFADNNGRVDRKQREAKAIQMPAWELVSIDFVEFVEQKSNKKSNKNRKAKDTDDSDDDLIRDDEDDRPSRKTGKSDRPTSAGRTGRTGRAKNKEIEEEEEDLDLEDYSEENDDVDEDTKDETAASSQRSRRGANRTSRTAGRGNRKNRAEYSDEELLDEYEDEDDE